MPLNSQTLPDAFLRRIDPADPIRKARTGYTQEERNKALEAKDEKRLQSDIQNLLRQRDIVFGLSRFNVKSTYTEGWPDFSFCIKGRAIFWECKTADGDLTNEQRDMRNKLVASGAVYITLRSLNQARQELAKMELEVLK